MMRTVIRWAIVLEVLGYFMVALTPGFVAPMFLGFLDQDSGFVPLLLAAVISAAVGATLIVAFRGQREEFNNREGILLVVLTWFTAGVLGALPFYFSDFFPTFTDAFFESVSGFTTTGATILTDIESLPRSLLFGGP